MSTATAAITVAELVQQFLDSKRGKVQTGELTARSADRYQEVSERLIIAVFGGGRAVESLTPGDFTKLRLAMARGCSASTLGDRVQVARTLFKFAFDAGLIDRPLRAGPDFRKPPAIALRRQRKESGPRMMFEAEEVRALLLAADPIMRAIVLVAINCGFGPSDIGRLPMDAIDLDGGWINYARAKTGIDRRCPLWPETVSAIRRALLLRATPRDETLSNRVFLNFTGGTFADGEPSPPLCGRFHSIRVKAGIGAAKGFYALRRSFATIADAAMDRFACDTIMGHTPAASDMPRRYIQRIDDSRLRAVADHVRRWLWPEPSLNIFEQEKQRAKEILAQWRQRQCITPDDLRTMMVALGISGKEIALSIGKSQEWISMIVCGRARFGAGTDRTFIEFLARLAGEEYSEPKPDELMLPDDLLRLLARRRITAAAVRALMLYLMQCRIEKYRLAEWLGCEPKVLARVFKLTTSPTESMQVKLRELFAVELSGVRRIGGAR